ncbi:hypothetical protein GT755_09830 [Herbidospora sp. NEAU-GS84]|uniref:Uncharacterized protein n=1 Tax=Herbidospora solisilvae TaxID=2696284 RepID=A0A7C9J1N2_9ACTN|nr:hypothetical protein [Herbidospora solisilvae]NAS21982.1 hypothetical protein [Herbidospora solisilvae]
MGIFGPSKREREEAAAKQAEATALRASLLSYYEAEVKKTRAALQRQHANSARTDRHAAQYLLRQAEANHSIVTDNLSHLRESAKEKKSWWRS